MREHDPGTTAAPGGAAGRAAPNGNAGTAFGASDGAGTAGRASCLADPTPTPAGGARVDGVPLNASGTATAPDWCDWPEADWLASHFRKEMAECRTMRDLRATAENILGCVESLRARVRADRAEVSRLRAAVAGQAAVLEQHRRHGCYPAPSIEGGMAGYSLPDAAREPARLSPEDVEKLTRAARAALATPTPAAPGARGA